MEFPIPMNKLDQKIIFRCIIFWFLLNGLFSPCFSQKQRVSVYPTVGLTWRSTAMNFFNFKAVNPADPTVPYPYERNVQGLSLNTGVFVKTSSFGFEYYLNLRYDVTHNDLKIEDTYYKEFITDHNFNFILQKKIDYGIGISIVNFNKGFEFENPVGVMRYQDIQFNSYNFLVILPLKKKFYLELKALYIPHGFPENPNEKYMMYSIRFFYKIKLKGNHSKLD